MKNILAIVLVAVLFEISCKKEEEIPMIDKTLPTPDFSITTIFNQDSTIAMKLKNLSKDAESYVWYLDDSDSSTAFEPIFQATENRPYKIKLKAINKNGSNSIIQTKYIYSIPVIADFGIIINLDTPDIVRFINKSKNFEKITWDFGDNFKSSESNPTHQFLNNNIRKVKLVAENKQKIKDSTTIVFNYNQWYEGNEYECYLKSLNDFTYVIKKNYSEGRGTKAFSFGPYFNPNPTLLKDSIIYNSNTSEKSYFISYYTDKNIMSYQKHSTLDAKDFISDLQRLVGWYTFDDRTSTSTSSPPPKHYNDTILNISNSNGLFVLEDKTLNHKFMGYLSSLSTKDEYIFEYPMHRINNTNIYKQIVFSRITNSIVAQIYYTWSAFGHSSQDVITYRGHK